MTSAQEMQREEKELTSAYQQYAKSLRRYAFSKICNRETCEDLVQDTFTKSWEYLVKGGKIDMMRAFLYHILNHLIVDEYRRKRNGTVSLDVLHEKGYESSADPSKSLYAYLDGKMAMLSINQLPKKYREVMQMRYVKGLSLEEIAENSHEPRNTISVQTHRALTKLRRLHHA